MRRAIAALLLALVSACTTPPPEAFVGGVRRDARPLDLGTNQFGEACSLLRGPHDGQIFCGTYVDPAGHVTVEADNTDAAGAITDSPWRRTLDLRFACAAPTPTDIDGTPGLTMACVRRQGGWPHTALAVWIGGTVYLADGVKPADPALRRAIGVMAGRLSEVEAKANDATGLTTRRQAASADKVEGAGAIAEAEYQLTRGGLENRRGNYAASESAYRAALTIQERVLGPDNPALAPTIARLALQVSNQGRFAEADRLLTRAERLATSAHQIDPVARPMVAYLRALHLLNVNRAAEALALLNEAEAGFAAVVPPQALATRVRGGQAHRSAVEQMADAAADAALMANPSVAEAMNGLLESRRYRAIALSALGRTAEADAALASARELYAGRDPRLMARYLRTSGVATGSAGKSARAASVLGAAADIFARVQPATIPLAQTQLLQAAELVAAGDHARAIPLCRDAAAILTSLRAGLPPELFTPCLEAFAAARAAGPDSRAEMFAISQLAQGAITSRQIARATARLAEGARDPAVAEAMRKQDQATQRLDLLFLRRAELGRDADRSPEATAIDAEIGKVREQLRDAGQAIQAASPRLSGLVQETASVQEVQSVLGTGEALATIVLGETEGWTFVIRHDGLTMARIDGGAKRVDALVTRIRATMLPDAENRVPAFDTAAAAELYAAVLGPVQPALQDLTQLTVSATGSLLSVPFNLLLTAPWTDADLHDAPFLIRRVAVSHVPSPGGFVNLRRSARVLRASRSWFGMGDFRPPTPSQARATFPSDTCGDSARMLASLSPLPGALRELEASRQILGASQTDEMLGAAFTAAHVLATNLSGYRMLHFATHAVLPSELRCQAEPAVLTSTASNAPDARGAMLTASLIERMNLDAELVILAACNTAGPGGTGAGESLSGLARSFFFAGARALLVTHWEANDLTTTYLTVLFLQALQATPNAGPAQALAAAQRRMLAESTGARAIQAHPYYWAVEALIGGDSPNAGAARRS